MSTTDVYKRQGHHTVYGHLGHITNRIFNYFDENPKTQIHWFTEVKQNLTEMKLRKMTRDNIMDRDIFRKKVKEIGGFSGKREVRNKKYLAENRKREHDN